MVPSLSIQDDYRLQTVTDVDGTTSTILWNMGNVLSELLTGGSEVNFTLSGPELDSPLERTTTTGHETLLTDHLMTALATIDDTDAVVRTTEYTAYGSVRSGADPGTIGFAGARRDPKTGLYYMRNRYYSPELGRFVSRDPIGFLGGGNMYGYVGNNPSRTRDPLGLADQFEYWDESRAQSSRQRVAAVFLVSRLTFIRRVNPFRLLPMLNLGPNFRPRSSVDKRCWQTKAEKMLVSTPWLILDIVRTGLAVGMVASLGKLRSLGRRECGRTVFSPRERALELANRYGKNRVVIKTAGGQLIRVDFTGARGDSHPPCSAEDSLCEPL